MREKVKVIFFSNGGFIILSTLWTSSLSDDFVELGSDRLEFVKKQSLCHRLASLDGIFYACTVPSLHPSHKVHSSAPQCLLLHPSHSCWPQPQSTAALLDTVRNGKREDTDWIYSLKLQGKIKSWDPKRQGRFFSDAVPLTATSCSKENYFLRLLRGLLGCMFITMSQKS